MINLNFPCPGIFWMHDTFQTMTVQHSCKDRNHLSYYLIVALKVKLKIFRKHLIHYEQ